jgi:hypothetical protein
MNKRGVNNLSEIIIAISMHNGALSQTDLLDAVNTWWWNAVVFVMVRPTIDIYSSSN